MSASSSTAEALRSTVGPIPKTMRAGVYREKGIVRVEEVPVPKVADGEVLIKVVPCGICGTEIKNIYHPNVPPPHILCEEIAVTVLATGPSLTTWLSGARG